MTIRRVGGVAGTHRLEGPGQFNGARVAVGALTGPAFIMTGAIKLAAFAAGAGVGAGPGSGLAGQVHSGPAGPHVDVITTNNADWLDVDFSGPFG